VRVDAELETYRRGVLVRLLIEISMEAVFESKEAPENELRSLKCL